MTYRKRLQILAAVHKSNVLNSATKLILSNLSPNLSAYKRIERIILHTDLTDHTDLVRGGALTGGLNTRFFRTRITRMTRILFARGGAERNVDF